MTNSEEQFSARLKELQEQGKWIELQLRPEVGGTTISPKSVNRAFINEGRLGKFNDISESYYDAMVDAYDSRMQKKEV